MFHKISQKITGFFNNLTDLNQSQVTQTIREILIGSDMIEECIDLVINHIDSNWSYIKSNKDLDLQLQKAIGNLFLDHKFRAISGGYILYGMEGSGKTTFAAKLGVYLRDNKENCKPLIVSLDNIRPAGVDQLKTLCNKVGLDFVDGTVGKVHTPYDVVIYDTPGNSAEIELNNVVERLLVVNSLWGKQAVYQSLEKARELNITGLVITCCDEEDRGGLCLSISKYLNLPIYFIGNGEHLKDLELFEKNTISKMVVGSFDLESIQKIASTIPQDIQKNLEEKVMSGNFNYNDMLNLIDNTADGTLNKMLMFSGGMAQNKEQMITMMKSMRLCILSMNKEEREDPLLLGDIDLKKVLSKDPSLSFIPNERIFRISKGAGVTVDDVIRAHMFFMTLKKIIGTVSQSPSKIYELMNSMKDGRNILGMFSSLFG